MSCLKIKVNIIYLNRSFFWCFLHGVLVSTESKALWLCAASLKFLSCRWERRKNSGKINKIPEKLKTGIPLQGFSVAWENIRLRQTILAHFKWIHVPKRGLNSLYWSCCKSMGGFWKDNFSASGLRKIILFSFWMKFIFLTTLADICCFKHKLA